MHDLRNLLRRTDPDRLIRDAMGLAATCTLILVVLSVPLLG
jgi:hypothetical protein